MKTLTSLPLIALFFLLFQMPLSGQAYKWALALGGPQDDAADNIALDPAGDIIIAGKFSGTANLNPGGTPLHRTAIGQEDIYISKRNPANGDLKWLKTYGKSGGDELWDMVVGQAGDIYIAGSEYPDRFIAKIDTHGNEVWQKQLVGKAHVRSLATDSEGNVYCAGHFRGTISFSSSTGQSITSVDGEDLFIGKLNSNGDVLWLKQFAGNGFGTIFSMETGADGNLYILAVFLRTLDFDPSASGQFLLTSLGGVDLAYVKLDSTGQFKWVRQIGGTSDEQAASVRLDGHGNSYLLGTFINFVEFNVGGSSTGLNGNGWSYETFVAKYDTAGTFIWANRIAGDDFDYPSSMVVDNSGDVYICGITEGDISFPGLDTTYQFAGGYDAFMAKIDSSGNWSWSASIQDTGEERLVDMAIDSAGTIYAVGKFRGQVDFDPSNNVQDLSSNGKTDGFLWKLGLPGLSGIDAAANRKITLFPNPSNGSFFLETPYGGIEEVNVFDTMGKEIFARYYFGELRVELNLDAPPGMYFVKVKRLGEQPTTLKILKK